MARDSGLLAQLRLIAGAVEVLPEVRDHLAALDERLIDIGNEVRRMREGVDRLDGRFEELNGSVQGIDNQFSGMRGDIGNMDRQLRELRKALSPLQRALAGVGRLNLRRRGNGEED